MSFDLAPERRHVDLIVALLVCLLAYCRLSMIEGRRL